MMRPFDSRRSSFRRNTVLQRLESRILRLLILGVVLLTVFQMNTGTDPVDFYLRFSGDIDAPAFKYHYYMDENSSPGISDSDKLQLEFETIPVDTPVKIWQQDELVGVISDVNKSFMVKPGTVTLDAVEIPYPVTVEIILNQKRYRMDLNQDVKSFTVQLQPPAAS